MVIVGGGKIDFCLLKLRPAGGLVSVRCGLKLGRPSIWWMGRASWFFRVHGPEISSAFLVGSIVVSAFRDSSLTSRLNPGGHFRCRV